MTSMQVFVVTYNDKYGNGNNKSMEFIVHSKKDFLKWLERHNEFRESIGELREDESEFDLMPTYLITF